MDRAGTGSAQHQPQPILVLFDGFTSGEDDLDLLLGDIPVEEAIEAMFAEQQPAFRHNR